MRSHISVLSSGCPCSFLTCSAMTFLMTFLTSSSNVEALNASFFQEGFLFFFEKTALGPVAFSRQPGGFQLVADRQVPVCEIEMDLRPPAVIHPRWFDGNEAIMKWQWGF